MAHWRRAHRGEDDFADDEWIAGSESLVTDGTWIWPVDLVHYVRRHHVALPQEFLEHIRANSYTAPAVPDERTRQIFHEEFPDNAGSSPIRRTPGTPPCTP